MIILGIDPGSRVTGYGLIELKESQQHYLSSGCIRSGLDLSFANRLQEIYAGISEIVAKYQPQEVAIEQIFMHINPGAALKLGQARGAAMVAASQTGLSIAEYSARQIKQAVVGYGAATKQQVQHMVCYLLKLAGKPQADAADALAVALCHANSRQQLGIKKQQMGHMMMRRGRVR